MSEAGPLYLGFDLSTQQLKAIVIQSDLHVLSEAKVDFDADFGKQYGLNKGVLVNDDEGEVFAPVAMWLEAIDLVLTRLRDGGAQLHRIRGVSGACQQHGSVYWNHDAEKLLAGMGGSGAGGDKSLKELLSGSLSHPFAPNWQDHSTQAQCDEFDAALGDNSKLADVTGSAAHHRFTGPQIMRLRKKLPDMYANTARISLVSSWLASIMLGAIAPLDIGDVGGMNLWDIRANKWDEKLLRLAAGGQDGVSALRSKLGEPRQDGGGSMGGVSHYFVNKYGFSPECQVVPFTGDNQGTILALPLRPLDAIVSLGTSSTFLMITPTYKPDPSYHFMAHPCTPGQYMFMLCYKNGGLARERVRDSLPAVAEGEADRWANFNEAVLSTPPLDVADPSVADAAAARAKLGLYFYLPEIVPNIKAGTWRYTCNAKDGSDLREADNGSGWPAAKDARAIVESQALSMRLRSQNLVHAPDQAAHPGLPAQPRRIFLVGGGSLNPAIARVMGDVLGSAEGVYKLDVGGNACALGGAYKALWALERQGAETFDELIGKRWKEEGAVEKVGQGYRKGVFEQYGAVLGAFGELEEKILQVAHN